MMELERSKKKKCLKSRELSPPPPALTLDELKEGLIDNDERQPSTSGTRIEDTTKVGSEDISISGENIVKSEEKFIDTISTHKSSSVSREINETEKFAFLKCVKKFILTSPSVLRPHQQKKSDVKFHIDFLSSFLNIVLKKIADFLEPR